MRNRLLFVLILGTMLAASSLGKERTPTPQELIESSRKASDFSQAGPYQLRATVILKPSNARQVTGQITVLRDVDLYRSELQVAQYREVRWGNQNKLYIGRSQAVPVPKTILLRHLDRLWRAPLLPANARISRVFKEKHNHRELECFEVSRDSSPKQRLCFDPSISVLMTEAGLEFHDLEFSEYSMFEEKYFPTRIIFRERDRVALEVKDITISRANFGHDVFTAPAGSPGFDTCDDPLPPRRVKDAIPRIPRTELSQLRSANVYLYGIIATDETVQNIAVEYSPHESFTQSTVEAIRQWRYTPAMCGDKPVPTETEMFTLYFIP